MRIYVVPDNVAERVDHWAAKCSDGGWQSLCREIQACEEPQLVALRLRGISEAIETLEVLKTAVETERK